MNKPALTQQQKADLALKGFAIFALLFVAALSYFYIDTETRPESALGVSSYSQLGGDFTLHSQQGDVSLSDFKGKVVVIYFGYLSCPDVCPASMAVIRRAFAQLSDEELEQVQGMLITVDPKRDSLQKLDQFTTFYHPNMLGLSGTVDEIQGVADLYGAYFEVLDKGTDDAYLVDHVSRYYVVGRDGVLVDALRHGSTANELSARIKQVLGQNPS